MVDYIDKNARWQMLSAVFALYIALVAISTYVASLFVYEWLGILVGCIIILFAIIPHRLGKINSAAYILSVAMNGIGTGFAISAYYIVKEKPVSVSGLIFVSLIAAALYTLANLLIYLFRKKNTFIMIFGIAVGLILISSVVLWIIRGGFLYSFGFFASLLLLFFLSVTAITIWNPARVALRDLSFGAFGSFVVAALVVVAILSEGDIVDGVDIADATKKGKKKSTK